MGDGEEGGATRIPPSPVYFPPPPRPSNSRFPARTCRVPAAVAGPGPVTSRPDGAGAAPAPVWVWEGGTPPSRGWGIPRSPWRWTLDGEGGGGCLASYPPPAGDAMATSNLWGVGGEKRGRGGGRTQTHAPAVHAGSSPRRGAAPLKTKWPPRSASPLRHHARLPPPLPGWGREAGSVSRSQDGDSLCD